MTAPLLPTVFLSYRRNVSSFIARAVFQDLRQHGYDVFMDVESIDSGQLDAIILTQIAARTYFLVILTQGTLESFRRPLWEVGRTVRRAGMLSCLAQAVVSWCSHD